MWVCASRLGFISPCSPSSRHHARGSSSWAPRGADGNAKRVVISSRTRAQQYRQRAQSPGSQAAVKVQSLQQSPANRRSTKPRCRPARALLHRPARALLHRRLHGLRRGAPRTRGRTVRGVDFPGKCTNARTRCQAAGETRMQRPGPGGQDPCSAGPASGCPIPPSQAGVTPHPTPHPEEAESRLEAQPEHPCWLVCLPGCP